MIAGTGAYAAAAFDLVDGRPFNLAHHDTNCPILLESFLGPIFPQ